MTEMITQIEINGSMKEARGTLLFVKTADKIYNEPNIHGVKEGGFSNIYRDLVASKSASALSAFWRCAFPGYKEDVIDNALTNAIREHGWTPLIRGAVYVLENDLILKGQVENFYENAEMGLHQTKDPEVKAEIEEGIQTIKQMAHNLLNPQQNTIQENQDNH
ncbi:hypothetical protein ETI10_01750 [Macrococcoides goetzii]|nr:tail assembly chaperone [Macrococcus goetzii]TDM41835.1 hypothetical protein ETI10_01750 [Macrococcus goetzii]